MKATYQIDPAHSSAHFTVRHMMISNVRGSFSKVTGSVVYDAEKPTESTIEADIDVNSINTGEPQRDAHLKSADFLDVEKYPTIVFKSKKIEAASDGAWKVTGDLTIHGTARETMLKVDGPTPENTDPFGNVRIGASAATKIKRGEFGLKWNAVLETGGLLVGDELKIELELSLIKAAVKTA